jgi:hypothetical protein
MVVTILMMFFWFFISRAEVMSRDCEGPYIYIGLYKEESDGKGLDPWPRQSVIQAAYNKNNNSSIKPSGTISTVNCIFFRLSILMRAPIQQNENPASLVFLPFVGATFYCISRIRSKHKNKIVGRPLRKLTSLL